MVVDLAEGTALIEELIAFATQQRPIYAHRWRQGDILIRDNRCSPGCDERSGKTHGPASPRNHRGMSATLSRDRYRAASSALKKRTISALKRS